MKSLQIFFSFKPTNKQNYVSYYGRTIKVQSSHVKLILKYVCQNNIFFMKRINIFFLKMN